jgi:hypothetical protein
MRPEPVCIALVSLGLGGCTAWFAPAEAPTGQEGPGADPVAEAPAWPDTPGPTLLLSTARFEATPEGVETLPARLVLLREVEGTWVEDHLDDPASNVFHKAVPWRDGLLTIGAEDARVVHWTRDAEAWEPTVLWEASFGGTFDRMRDVELGDVDGDGADEIVVATHDQGVVAVGDEADGAWTFTELDRSPGTFVHEIALGDLDGDGTQEIHATPSAPNPSSGASQPGRVVRYVHGPEGYERDVVIAWTDTHAKEVEVLPAPDGPALVALREGVVGPAGVLKEPVQVVRLDPDAADGGPRVLATLPGEKQARFLVSGDVDHDGTTEWVITGMRTGVWLLEPPEAAGGPFSATQVDGSGRGFEQAAHVADLDGDGRVELYVAHEPDSGPRQVRRYVWPGPTRTVLHTLDGLGLVWGIADGTL